MAEGSQDYWQKALRFPMRLLAKGSRFSSTLLAEGSDVPKTTGRGFLHAVDYCQKVPKFPVVYWTGSWLVVLRADH